MTGLSAARIYTLAAPLCLVAPALVPTPMNRVVWSYVLLGGLPMCVMAILLAVIHAQHGLRESEPRTTALVWTAAVILVLTPLDIWLPFANSPRAIAGVRAIASVLAALLLVRLSARLWKMPSRARLVLAIGILCAAIFFGGLAYETGPWVTGSETGGIEAAAQRLAEFFIDAVGTCAVLLFGVVITGLSDRRHNVSATQHEI